MAAAIDATVGGASSNSYATVAEAVTHFEARTPSTLWDAASADLRIRALISAARRLDQEQYAGTKADSAQAMKWPRAGAADPDGVAIESTVIPAEMKEAQCELAYALLGTDLLADSGLEGFESVVLGPIEVTPAKRTAGALPAHVRREIAHLLTTPSSANVRLLRG